MIVLGCALFHQNRRSPLHVAAYAGSACCVGWLMSHGADVNARDNVSEFLCSLDQDIQVVIALVFS